MRVAGSSLRKILGAGGSSGGSGAVAGVTIFDLDFVEMPDETIGSDGDYSWDGVDVEIIGVDANTSSAEIDSTGLAIAHNNQATSNAIAFMAAARIRDFSAGFDVNRYFEVDFRGVGNQDQNFEHFAFRIIEENSNQFESASRPVIGAAIGHASGSDRIVCGVGAVGAHSQNIDAAFNPDVIRMVHSAGQISFYAKAHGGAAASLPEPGDLTDFLLVHSSDLETAGNDTDPIDSDAALIQLYGFSGNGNANFAWAIERVRLTQYNRFA